MSEFSTTSHHEQTVYLVAPIPDPDSPVDLRETAKLFVSFREVQEITNQFRPEVASAWKATLSTTTTWTLSEPTLVDDPETELRNENQE